MPSTLLKNFSFEEQRGTSLIAKEPIGVCGLITPWNWPPYQITSKVAPAMAAGCTVVLKPCELAPFTGLLFAEVMHEAGAPAGVFNLVTATGQVSAPRCRPSRRRHGLVHRFDPRRRDVAQAAAATIKRVTQELGGKCPNVVSTTSSPRP